MSWLVLLHSHFHYCSEYLCYLDLFVSFTVNVGRYYNLVLSLLSEPSALNEQFLCMRVTSRISHWMLFRCGAKVYPYLNIDLGCYIKAFKYLIRFVIATDGNEMGCLFGDANDYSHYCSSSASFRPPSVC